MRLRTAAAARLALTTSLMPIAALEEAGVLSPGRMAVEIILLLGILIQASGWFIVDRRLSSTACEEEQDNIAYHFGTSSGPAHSYRLKQ